jgi:hypothetical protein
MFLKIMCLMFAVGMVFSMKQETVMQAGERLILPTFSDGIIALTMQANGTLQVAPFLSAERTGAILVTDSLPDGRLAMGGLHTQLLLYDETRDELTALTNFPMPVDWQSISLRADATLGLFESIDPIERIRMISWLTDFTEDPLPVVPVMARLSPSLSFDGQLVGVTNETPLDAVTMIAPSRHIAIVQVEDMGLSIEPIYKDEGNGWCFGVQFHPTAYQVAYLCDYATLVIYDIEHDTRQEFDVMDGLCVRWSPEGERVVVTVFSIGMAAPMYQVIDLITEDFQVLSVPEDTPNYDATAVCPAWLGE